MNTLARSLTFSVLAAEATLILSGPARAATMRDAERLRYERRIEALESRVDRLEQVLAAFSKEMRTNGPETGAREIVQAASWKSPQEVSHIDLARKQTFETPPELVPEVGKIGAEVGLFLSGSLNPFQLNKGTFTGGFIDLPLFDQPDWLHGKISYEISVGLSQSRTTFNTTSNVAQVANLSALNALYPNGGLQNLTEAISGTGPAPFNVTTSTETRLRLLQVVPFALKYTNTSLDRWRLRPYVVAGFGTYVTIHDQNPARGNPASYGARPDAQLPPAILAALNQIFVGRSPFGAPLVAGQIGQSPELVARGLPGGNGNIDLGIHVGGGLAFRVNHLLSLGFDVRYNKIAGSNANLTTYGSRISLHF